MKFCSECGHKVGHVIPDMDDRLRFVCSHCEIIHYENPKVVVGCVPYWQDKVLLCKRAIEPRKGYWTVPAGYMENGESTFEGAQRETFEEAGASYSQASLYRLFDIPFIDQVYVFYLAELNSPTCAAGIESMEVEFFDEASVPWDELAFPIMYDVLKEFFADKKVGQFPVRIGLPISPLKI